MHVVMLSDLESRGGASVAASRLATALCDDGHRVTRVVANPDRRDHPWQTHVIAYAGSIPRAALRLALPDSPRERWDQHFAANNLHRQLAELNPDIINIHNLHGARSIGWSAQFPEVCARHAPVVWTLHDMWSFTGRCAYSYDCCQFTSGCDARCPTPTEHPALAPERISSDWNHRRGFFSKNAEVAAVAPSHWMARTAKKGLWGGHSVNVIPNGLPINIYRPIDSATARQALDVPSDRPIVMVAAEDLSERRKGGQYLNEALNQLSGHAITLLTLGNKSIATDSSNVRVHPLGFVDHERTRVLAYSAADLLVHPAPVDNFPNVVLEALACGTPIVGFPIGGVPEVVRPGKTGWLASELSADALSAALTLALNDIEDGVNLRAAARKVVESEYDVRLQASGYEDLFSSLATQRSGALC